jgi:hypothetical protein
MLTALVCNSPGSIKALHDFFLKRCPLILLAWALQGEALPAISRFQAVAVGSKVYIHTHRSLEDILVLDVTDADAPALSLQPVASQHGEPPMSR